MTLRTSSQVTTRWTPGTFFAALVSIDLMRPCATVLRKIFPCSMPGSRMVWVYSARPVTLSRASRRGSERPTCPPAAVVVDAIRRKASMRLLHVGSERRGGILHETMIEHGLDRHRAVDLLGVLEEGPG